MKNTVIALVLATGLGGCAHMGKAPITPPRSPVVKHIRPPVHYPIIVDKPVQAPLFKQRWYDKFKHHGKWFH